MSDVKRFGRSNASDSFAIIECRDGVYCYYHDYAALQARLTEMDGELNQSCDETADATRRYKDAESRCTQLQAQLDRLVSFSIELIGGALTTIMDDLQARLAAAETERKALADRHYAVHAECSDLTIKLDAAESRLTEMEVELGSAARIHALEELGKMLTRAEQAESRCRQLEEQLMVAENKILQTGFICNVLPHHDRLIFEGRYYSVEQLREALSQEVKP